MCETSFYEYPVAAQSRLSLGKWLSANKGGPSLHNLAGPSAAISLCGQTKASATAIPILAALL